MKGRLMLYIDQYGNKCFARTVKELHAQFGGRIGRMYQDKIDGRTVHVGYVVGSHWFTAYVPYEASA